MKRPFLLFATLLLSTVSSVSLCGADAGNVDKRDIIVDSAIGGMREGSRIVAPDTYGKKTEIPKTPGTQLGPMVDMRVAADTAAGGAAAGTAAAGNFPGGQSAGIAAGIEAPSGPGAGGLAGGDTITPGGSVPGAEPGFEEGATADSGGGSLIDIDASADLSGGNIDAGVSLDTDNTDQILDADLAAGASENVDITGGTDITAGDITADSELPLETTESAISSETDIGTEVDTSGGAVGGEADIGVEADVEGGGEGDDIANDPADGLPGI